MEQCAPTTDEEYECLRTLVRATLKEMDYLHEDVVQEVLVMILEGSPMSLMDLVDLAVERLGEITMDGAFYETIDLVAAPENEEVVRFESTEVWVRGAEPDTSFGARPIHVTLHSSEYLH